MLPYNLRFIFISTATATICISLPPLLLLTLFLITRRTLTKFVSDPSSLLRPQGQASLQIFPRVLWFRLAPLIHLLELQARFPGCALVTIWTNDRHLKLHTSQRSNSFITLYSTTFIIFILVPNCAKHMLKIFLSSFILTFTDVTPDRSIFTSPAEAYFPFTWLLQRAPCSNPQRANFLSCTCLTEEAVRSLTLNL